MKEYESEALTFKFSFSGLGVIAVCLFRSPKYIPGVLLLAIQ